FICDGARCDFSRYSLSVGNRLAHFRDVVAPTERFKLWKFGLGRCIDSFQLYGGSGVGQCHRSIVEISAVAAVASLRCTGARRGLLWLHNCLRPSASGRVDAARLANAVELSADAHWIAFCPVIPYSVDTDNGDGPDTAGIGGRSDFAPVCSFVFHRFRGYARGCPGWDRARQHCGWRDSPPLGATESIASSPVAAGRDSDAFFIFVLSRGSGSNARRSIRRLLAADWVPLHRLDIPSRVFVGDFVSLDRCMCSSQRRRPYEQHRDYHVV